MPYTLDALSEYIPDHLRPPLDREIADGPLTERQFAWRDTGYLVLENLIPEDLILSYCDRYLRENAGPLGYGIGTPYMQVPEIRDLCLYAPLMDVLKELIGSDMGMHLNLTGWKSTERNWHQDDYLNPPYINGHYAAVWFALDDIHPDAGPFEFIPGSHVLLPACRGEKVRAALEPFERESPNWPRYAERILDDLYEDEIRRRGLRTQTWCGKRGDVLIWHPWLLHRGSRPNDPNILRPGIITHYSALSHRQDMATRALHENGESRGYYFVL